MHAAQRGQLFTAVALVAASPLPHTPVVRQLLLASLARGFHLRLELRLHVFVSLMSSCSSC